MEIIFTTTNKYKIKSAETVLNKYGIKVIGKAVDIVEIQDPDPIKVAIDKAKKSYEIIKKPLIVMDSGLFINSLKGFPGVFTKYALDTIAEDGFVALTKNVADKSAYVQRIICYIDEKDTKIFQSKGEGEIINEKKGKNGYGYDLIFYVKSKNKTLAEMALQEQIEVWGDAWDQLAMWLINK